MESLDCSIGDTNTHWHWHLPVEEAGVGVKEVGGELTAGGEHHCAVTVDKLQESIADDNGADAAIGLAEANEAQLPPMMNFQVEVA